MTGWLQKETLLAGINTGFYHSWCRFLAQRVQIYIKKTKNTIYGHQKLFCKGIRPCTKRKRSKIHDVGVAIFDPNNNDDMKNMIGMDIPIQVPTTSGSGNKYIFVMLDYNSDLIIKQPLCHNRQRKKWFNISNYAMMSLNRLVLPQNCSNLIISIKGVDQSHQTRGPCLSTSCTA